MAAPPWPPAAPILYVDVATTGDTVCVRLTGELDLSSAEQVRRAVTASGGSRVVVDLTGCTFMDAAGLTSLLDRRRALQARGQEVRLEGARGIVRRVFGIVGMDGVLDE
ncbi:MAG: STAS domain-containing protein [Acidimicrobiales bacterium]